MNPPDDPTATPAPDDVPAPEAVEASAPDSLPEPDSLPDPEAPPAEDDPPAPAAQPEPAAEDPEPEDAAQLSGGGRNALRRERDARKAAERENRELVEKLAEQELATLRRDVAERRGIIVDAQGDYVMPLMTATDEHELERQADRIALLIAVSKGDNELYPADQQHEDPAKAAAQRQLEAVVKEVMKR